MNILTMQPGAFFKNSNIDRIASHLRNSVDQRSVLRRKITQLSAMGMLDFAIISLYQTGVLKRLPDFPGKLFDSNKVNASRKAYAMGLPDGTTGASLFAITMVLANLGGARALGRAPIWDKLTLAAVGTGAIAGAEYLFDMLVKQKRICLYCVSGAVLSAAMLGPAARLVKRKS
jgi:uncharacterized membrane protein